MIPDCLFVLYCGLSWADLVAPQPGSLNTWWAKRCRHIYRGKNLFLRNWLFLEAHCGHYWTEALLRRSLFAYKNGTITVFLSCVAWCCIALNTHLNCFYRVRIGSLHAWRIHVLLRGSWKRSACLLVRLLSLHELGLAQLSLLYDFISFVAHNLPVSCPTSSVFVMRPVFLLLRTTNLQLAWQNTF